MPAVGKLRLASKELTNGILKIKLNVVNTKQSWFEDSIVRVVISNYTIKNFSHTHMGMITMMEKIENAKCFYAKNIPCLFSFLYCSQKFDSAQLSLESSIFLVIAFSALLH